MREVERVERETEKRTDRIVERPSRATPPASRPSPSPRPAPTTEAPRRLELPDVPLEVPEDVGKATDDVKDIAEDTVNELLP